MKLKPFSIYTLMNLSEAKEGKLTHLDHAEEMIINNGSQGASETIDLLYELSTNMAGGAESNSAISVKFDGCIHEDSILMTSAGELSIKEICHNNRTDITVMGKDFNDNIDKMTEVSNTVYKKGLKDWFEIKLENGESIKVTADHEIHTSNRGWVEAQYLTTDDEITELWK